MDNQSLSHVHWKCQCHSIHSKVSEESIVCEVKKRCEGNYFNIMQV